MVYAGFWIRTLAAIIDSLLAQIVAVLLLVIPLGLSLEMSMGDDSSPEHFHAAAEAVGFMVGFLVQWLWFTIPESSAWQGSVGKKMLGLRVTDDLGGRIGFGKANARFWSKFLSMIILLFGFLMVAFTDKKQGLHDKIAGTLVIRNQP
ncbi:MAG: RDD family protein [Magnetococcales bacterium]|nr:RDD family protein [Magnetococcales bacterium]